MIDTTVGVECVDMGEDSTMHAATAGGNGDDEALPPDVTVVAPVVDDPYGSDPGVTADGLEVVPQGANAAEEKLRELIIATDYANEMLGNLDPDKKHHNVHPEKKVYDLPGHMPP